MSTTPSNTSNNSLIDKRFSRRKRGLQPEKDEFLQTPTAKKINHLKCQVPS